MYVQCVIIWAELNSKSISRQNCWLTQLHSSPKLIVDDEIITGAVSLITKAFNVQWRHKSYQIYSHLPPPHRCFQRVTWARNRIPIVQVNYETVQLDLWQLLQLQCSGLSKCSVWVLFSINVPLAEWLVWPQSNTAHFQSIWGHYSQNPSCKHTMEPPKDTPMKDNLLYTLECQLNSLTNSL